VDSQSNQSKIQPDSLKSTEEESFETGESNNLIPKASLQQCNPETLPHLLEDILLGLKQTRVMEKHF
jgi:hypothetical protein